VQASGNDDGAGARLRGFCPSENNGSRHIRTAESEAVFLLDCSLGAIRKKMSMFVKIFGTTTDEASDTRETYRVRFEIDGLSYRGQFVFDVAQCHRNDFFECLHYIVAHQRTGGK
jgi:hypothetical protein